MRDHINQFFDLLQLLVDRMPVLHHLIVELALLGLVVLGILALFKSHL